MKDSPYIASPLGRVASLSLYGVYTLYSCYSLVSNAGRRVWSMREVISAATARWWHGDNSRTQWLSRRLSTSCDWRSQQTWHCIVAVASPSSTARSASWHRQTDRQLHFTSPPVQVSIPPFNIMIFTDCIVIPKQYTRLSLFWLDRRLN